MSYLKKHIVDQIHDLESPLNARMTFEEVMQRREKKKRRLLLFWPRIVVVGGLFTAAGLGYFAWNSSHGKVKQSVVIAANHVQQPRNSSAEKQVGDRVKLNSQLNVEKPENKIAEKVTKKILNPIPNPISAIPEITIAQYNTLQSQNAISKPLETKSEILEVTRNIIPEGLINEIQQVTKSEIIAEISAVKNEQILNSITPEAINAATTNPETPANPIETSESVIDLMVSQKEINSAMDAEFQTDANRWLNIEALLALTHGKGLDMFEIPNPLSKSDFEAIFVDLEDDELNNYFKPGNFDSPYHLELSVGTGSRVLTNFDQTLPLSVLGNQYNAHYQLSLLKDLSNGIQLAVGMSYGEWEGNGQWQKREWNSYTVRDSSVLIGFPNPNDRQVIYFDSTVNELTTTQGGIKYQITKISIPIGFRKLMYLGKTPFRVAMQISPGRTIKSTGYYFSDFEFHSIDNQRLNTMDMKVALGPSISINRNFTVILEPNANMQMFHDSRTNRIHSKSFYGFGFSLIRHFN